jgi:hypothetical protein
MVSLFHSKPIAHARRLIDNRVGTRAAEIRLVALVTQACVLKPEDVALLWRTAPPRMPVGTGG